MAPENCVIAGGPHRQQFLKTLEVGSHKDRTWQATWMVSLTRINPCIDNRIIREHVKKRTTPHPIHTNALVNTTLPSKLPTHSCSPPNRDEATSDMPKELKHATGQSIDPGNPLPGCQEGLLPWLMHLEH